jgi:hypothetical protein
MKIIININDDIPVEQALMKVAQIIGGGRTSNDGKNYCYATAWENGTIIYVERNKKSDTFRVGKYKWI